MDAARLETDPRIRTRRELIERTRRIRMWWRVGAVALVVLIAWIAFWSPVLSVDRVRLRGARYTTAADVAEAADLRRSDNLLLVSTSDIEIAAETLPWVKRAEVRRVLPGTLRIKIVERRPAMALTLDAGARDARWLVDAGGRVLARSRASKNLPVLAGMTIPEIEAGDIVPSPEARAALAAYVSMPRALRTKVVAVFAPTVERLTFTMRDRTLVRYGAAEELDAKNSVLASVLAKLRSQGRAVAYIDIRVPASPAVSQQAPPDVLPTPTPAA
jgi:cell division protein FtsQ